MSTKKKKSAPTKPKAVKPTKAEQQIEAARALVHTAKSTLKQARKALKKAKHAAKEAGKSVDKKSSKAPGKK